MIYFQGVGGFLLSDWLGQYGLAFPGRWVNPIATGITKVGDRISVCGYGTADINGGRLTGFVVTVSEPSAFVAFAAASVLLLKRRRRV